MSNQSNARTIRAAADGGRLGSSGGSAHLDQKLLNENLSISAVESRQSYSFNSISNISTARYKS